MKKSVFLHRIHTRDIQYTVTRYYSGYSTGLLGVSKHHSINYVFSKCISIDIAWIDCDKGHCKKQSTIVEKKTNVSSISSHPFYSNYAKSSKSI